MNRWIVTVACACAFALAVPFGDAAEAAKYRNKKCIASAMVGVGAQTTWVCKAAEKCCYDWLLRKGTCTADRCF